MVRSYQQRKRAEERDRVRERILQATMQLHDEQGVAPTTFSQVAERAGVGPATVYRHFPKPGDLIQACGMHAWQEMRPPTPDAAPAVFAGAETTHDRLQRLIAELDDFYERGALRLGLAGRDRELVPELDMFLKAVEGGVAALVQEALKGATASEAAIKVVLGLVSFPVWSAFKRLDLPEGESARVRLRLLECGIAAANAKP